MTDMLKNYVTILFSSGAFIGLVGVLYIVAHTGDIDTLMRLDENCQGELSDAALQDCMRSTVQAQRPLAHFTGLILIGLGFLIQTLPFVAWAGGTALERMTTPDV